LDLEPFKDRLRRWRGARTRQEVSVLLGVSVRTIESWEVGYFKPTSKPSIREIEQKMTESTELPKSETKGSLLP